MSWQRSSSWRWGSDPFQRAFSSVAKSPSGERRFGLHWKRFARPAHRISDPREAEQRRARQDQSDVTEAPGGADHLSDDRDHGAADEASGIKGEGEARIAHAHLVETAQPGTA